MKVIEKIKNKKNIPKILFMLSIIFYLTIGLYLSYNYSFLDNYNLLFDSDTARVISDATEIAESHYRLSVHPLFIIVIQPVILLLKGVVLNKIISLIILSAIVSSISVVLIYKILDKINENNNKLNILISLIYLFSFANMVFTAGIEIYNYAALSLIGLLYFYINNEDKKLNNKWAYTILTILGVFSFGFTITNYMIFCIILFVLLISKKIKLKNIILVFICSSVLSVSLNIVQRIVWNNTPLIWQTNIREEKNENSYSFTKHNVINVIKNDYYNSIIANDIKMIKIYGEKYNKDNYKIEFKNNSLINIIVLTLLYISTLIVFIRNYKKKIFINIALLLSLAFNSALHCIYGNESTFLYSLHFLYLIILIIGLNLNLEENKKIKNSISLLLFVTLVLEIIKNTHVFKYMLKIVNTVLVSNTLIANLGVIKTEIIEFLVIILTLLLILLIINIYKKSKKERIKHKKIILISINIALVVLIQLIFITISIVDSQNKIFGIELKNKPLEKEEIDNVELLSKKMNENYKFEIEKYKEYKKEYEKIKLTYEHETFDKMNFNDYMYLGFANRKKYIYIDSSIKDVENGNVLYKFNEKNHLIIPNIYTIIIETKDNKLIKIFEDNDAVHIVTNNNEEILKDTDKYIELFNFNNQKYQNIKKTLYGEILYNIKEGIIYPNIFVYNKPWYRDAALTSMVLKNTNNTDLISEWVENIEDIYDRQNAGNEEPDNLGELLYIISTQEKMNDELIEKIEREAKRLAESNPNGYYIYGKTDFGDKYLYQNLWYKLGIESVKRKFEFNIENIPMDDYTTMAWWSDYEVAPKQIIETSKEYPYLSLASRHKLGKGKIVLNKSCYPLSWEKTASQANYSNYTPFDKGLARFDISPLHSWTASEFLLFILDETNDLSIN